VLTGDLTMDGHLAEYDKVKEYISSLRGPLLVVPGNHDAMNLGHETFEEVFGTRKPFFENDTVAVQGLDSSLPDINEGEVGRHNYPLVRSLGAKDRVRIIALHHHVIPVPGTGREMNILMDSGDFMKVCMEAGIHLVLSGHKHLPWVWKLNGVHFVTAGTACSDRLKGRSYPSINLFDLSKCSLSMVEVDVSTGRMTKRIEDAIS